MTGGYPIIGIVRFSFFGATDTRQKHEHESAMAELYDPERLEMRFRIFEHITLPSLRAQSDPNFLILFVTSDVMPTPWLERLQTLVATLPQGRLHIAKTQKFDLELTPILREICEASPNGRAAAFRLDDDDAVSRHYIRRVRELAVNLPEKTIITFPHTLSVFCDSDGSLGVIRRQVLCLSAGLVRIISTTYLRNPIAMMHGIVWKRFLTISDPTFPSNIMSYHNHNDTLAMREKHIHQFKEAVSPRLLRKASYWQNIADDLEEHFPDIDMPCLAETFGASLKPIQQTVCIKSNTTEPDPE